MEDFAEEQYYRATPIREIFAFNDVTKEDWLAWKRARLLKCIQHPKSNLVTVREKNTGRLLAFQALSIRERSEVWADSFVESDRSAAWRLRAILGKLDEGVDLFSIYQTERILHIWFTAVRADFRGQRLVGIRNPTCRALFAKIAHDNGIGAMRAEAVSRYSSPEKCWEPIKIIRYESFQLSDGTRPFDGINLGVHQTAKLMACRPPPLILAHQHFNEMEKSSE